MQLIITLYKKIMKSIILTLGLLFTSLLFSQEIKTENNKFYVDGTLVYKHEITKTLASNLPALKLYKKSRTKESIGGLLFGAGAGLIIGDVVKGLVSDVAYPSGFTYVGLGLIAVSIPVLHGKNKMRAQSIEMYNNGLEPKEKTLGYNFDVNFITSQNGIGFNIKF